MIQSFDSKIEAFELKGQSEIIQRNITILLAASRFYFFYICYISYFFTFTSPLFKVDSDEQ